MRPAALASAAAVGLLRMLALLAVALAVPRTLVAEAPVTVHAGIYLHDITNFDLKNGHFDVDADLWARWYGAFDIDQLRVANASEVELLLLGREQDGPWQTIRWRMHGTLRGAFPVDAFPFDVQTLAVVLELPESAGLLVPDLADSGVVARFSLSDWESDGRLHPRPHLDRYPSDLGHLRFEGREASLRRLDFEVTLSRPLRPTVTKLFLPLFIVALVVCCSLLVGAESLQPRLTMCLSGLVACFAFQFSVSNILPDVAYLTMADILFITVYSICVTCVLAAVAGYKLLQAKREPAARTLNRVLRVVVPGAAALVVWGAVPDIPPPVIDPPDPLPDWYRPASARDTLRMGTVGSPALMDTPVGIASRWPIVHRDPDAGVQGVLVERVPGPDNDAITFLPGGGMEVTWRLREGARWSDGTPVTPADLRLRLEASPDPALLEMTSPDDRTLVLRWRERLARALVAPEVWPAHAMRPVLQTQGYEAARRWMRSHPLPGIAPYRLVGGADLAPGASLTLEPNPHFPGAPPSIPRVNLQSYPTLDALVHAFVAGEVDATPPLAFTADHLARAQEARPGSVHVLPSADLLVLQVDLSDPRLQEQAVRAALLQAIPRQELARAWYGQGGRPAGGMLPDEDGTLVDRWPLDPEAARSLLAGQPWIDRPLELRVDAALDPAIVAGLVEAMEQVGLHITVLPVDDARDLWRAAAGPGLLLRRIHSERSLPLRHWWGLPRMQGRFAPDARNVCYTDAIHALVERSEHTLFVERERQLQNRVADALVECLPVLPLVWADERMLITPALRGWQRPADMAFGEGMEHWFFAADGG
jgi:ABC-type transport system substrate-binding protein